ncbi:MAG: branched-chain amino acid ABC transporter substrate-binding protein [Chloroflexota bacterium]
MSPLPPPVRRARSRVAILAVALAVTVAALPAVAQDALVVRVGITLPLSGSPLATNGPIRDGALLALAEAAIPGVRIEPVILDHAVNGVHNPQQGARDMTAFVADPALVAVIGPYNSSVGQAQIPISNEAGLFQCSPGTTNPELTKGDPARALRPAAPDRPSFVRTVTTDDVQAPAMAAYAYRQLGIRRVAIVDDTETYGKGAADAFAGAWERLGGTVTLREGVPPGTADYLPVLTRIAADAPDALYFGGLAATGAGVIRRQMAQAGLGDLPFLVGEGANDGSVDTPGTFLNTAGEAAGEVWTTAPSRTDYPGRAAFATAYTAAYGVEPTAFSATAYACGQVVVALVAAAHAAGSLDREVVRALATAPDAAWETILGETRFDAAGDITQRWISFFTRDPAIDEDPATPGIGAFVFAEQVDFGTEPLP